MVYGWKTFVIIKSKSSMRKFDEYFVPKLSIFPGASNKEFLSRYFVSISELCWTLQIDWSYIEAFMNSSILRGKFYAYK